MTCPICGGEVRTKQSVKDCEGVYRQRKCLVCNHVFYTTEVESDGEDYRRLMLEKFNAFRDQYREQKRASL